MGSKPRHIAIIMDGNGRWATNQGLSRSEGHRAGAQTVERVLQVCQEEEIEFLTLYAFSLENWSRPRLEIEALMKLLEKFLSKNLPQLIERGIRLQVIGRLSLFSKKMQKVIEEAIAKTATGKGAVLTLALSYGGRAEIVDATKKIVQEVLAGHLKLEDLDEKRFSQALYTATIPDPDMLIRTSGELRISNFLPWQCAYSEFFFTSTLWPDFSAAEFKAMIGSFTNRERRFGGVKTYV